MGAFFVMLFAGALYAFAGCPDPDRGVTHPDLEAALRDLDYDAALKRAERALPPPPKPLPAPSYRDEFGGGSL